MRYFAKVEDNNTVSKVVLFEDDFPEPVKFLTDEVGEAGVWLETWLDGGQRKNFACAGYDYDPELDAFIMPPLADYFVFDQDLAKWVPPTPKPEGDYYWDLKAKAWKESKVI